ncbi:MAG: hypothetical protein WDW38_005751 [Sanguina aurantia]
MQNKCRGSSSTASMRPSANIRSNHASHCHGPASSSASRHSSAPAPFSSSSCIQSANSRASTLTAHASATDVEVRTGRPKREDIMTSHPYNNVSDYIYEKIGTNLHRQPQHPIGIIKAAIQSYFETRTPNKFKTFDDLYPVVTTFQNFDEVLVPADHVSRSPNDTGTPKAVECRWIDAYFPFTEPSIELEIFFNGKWLEVLGCGVMQQSILDANYRPGHTAWAFGLGLERLAMVLFDVPDIRLFWSGDERFTRQFKAGDLKAKFKPYSKFPSCYKDMAFWVSPEFTENNLCELVRNIGGDLVEEVTLIDQFTNAKNGKTSNCFRITYRSMERSLTDEEINSLQVEVRKQTEEVLKVQLR